MLQCVQVPGNALCWGSIWIVFLSFPHLSIHPHMHAHMYACMHTHSMYHVMLWDKTSTAQCKLFRSQVGAFSTSVKNVFSVMKEISWIFSLNRFGLLFRSLLQPFWCWRSLTACLICFARTVTLCNYKIITDMLYVTVASLPFLPPAIPTHFH